MTARSPLQRRFAALLMLLAAMLLPGCGGSSYTIPPAELQRLTQIPPSQRGDHVRAFTPGVVPKEVAQPSPPATPPSPPPFAPTPQPPLAPPPPATIATGEVAPDPFGPDEVDLPESPVPGIVVAVDVGSRVPPHPPGGQARPAPALPLAAPVRTSVPAPAPARIAAPPATVRTSFPAPAPARIAAPPATVRTSVPLPAPGRIATPATAPRPPASPARGSVPAPRRSGGHSSGSSVSFPSGGGSGDAVLGAVLAVVVLVGLIAIVAEAAQPEPAFDGWIRTSPEHPVHLEYAGGREREVRLCDLQPADLVGLRAATITDFDGSIERLEAAADQPPPVTQPRPVPAPAPTIPPARPAPATPPVPPAAPRSDPFSCLVTFDRAA